MTERPEYFISRIKDEVLAAWMLAVSDGTSNARCPVRNRC
jgi:hypothetical protein